MTAFLGLFFSLSFNDGLIPIFFHFFLTPSPAHPFPLRSYQFFEPLDDFFFQTLSSCTSVSFKGPKVGLDLVHHGFNTYPLTLYFSNTAQSHSRVLFRALNVCSLNQGKFHPIIDPAPLHTTSQRSPSSFFFQNMVHRCHPWVRLPWPFSPRNC